MADPKPTHTYVGNPGYEFPFLGLAALHPGDTVTLTFEQADEAGEEFEPTGAFKKAKAERDAKADEAQTETAPVVETEAPAGADTEES